MSENGNLEFVAAAKTVKNMLSKMLMTVALEQQQSGRLMSEAPYAPFLQSAQILLAQMRPLEQHYMNLAKLEQVSEWDGENGEVDYDFD